MTDMVEHSSQDQDGEYYRKMDVRLGHSRRDVVFGYMLNLGCGLGDAGERYYSGEGNAVQEYFLQIFLQIVMRPSHFSSPEIFPLRYLQQVAAALLEPQSFRLAFQRQEHGRNGHPKATCCASIASSRRLSSFHASDGFSRRGMEIGVISNRYVTGR